MKKLLLAVLLLLPTPALAQVTGCNPLLTETQILSTFADNVPPGHITPRTMRDMVCSMHNVVGSGGQKDVTYASDIGADCTGATDSTTAIQNWVNTIGHNQQAHLRLPAGCHIVTTQPIVMTDMVGITFDSASQAGNGQYSTGVLWEWQGSAGANCATNFAACNYVLDFESVDSPVVQGITFFDNANGQECADGFLKFDGNPAANHIGTNGRILNNAFFGSECFGVGVVAGNPNFVAVNISQTATQNQENYIVDSNFVFCSFNPGVSLNRNATTNGTTTITDTADAPFDPVFSLGLRVRLSYSGGYVDSTIVSAANATHATMAAPSWSNSVTYAYGNPVTGSDANVYASIRDGNVGHNPVGGPAGWWTPMWTQSNVSMIIDQNYGIAVRNGASQNAIQQQVRNLQYTNCSTGVYFQGGNGELRHISGGASDTGIFLGPFVAGRMMVDIYDSENDFTGIDTAAQMAILNNIRMSNGKQQANGFLLLNAGQVRLENALQAFAVPTNGVLIGKKPPATSSAARLISVNNSYLDNYSAVGYSVWASAGQPVTSLGDVMGTGSPGNYIFGCGFGSSTAPTNCVQVNNNVNEGPVGLQVTSNNFTPGTTTDVLGLQVTDTLGIIRSYQAITTSASSGTITNQNAPLVVTAAALTVFGACIKQGEIAAVTTGSTSVWGAIDAGGGTNKVLDWCNGTNWTVVGK